MSLQSLQSTVAVGTGTNSWSSTTSANALDGVFSSCNLTGSAQTSANLTTSTYGFTIPTGATINGFTVIPTWKYSSGGGIITDVTVNLNITGAVGTSDNKATNTALPTPGALNSTYGSSSDLWGYSSIDETMINATTFGATIQVKSSVGAVNTTAFVDAITIGVWYNYTPAGEPQQQIYVVKIPSEYYINRD